MITAPQVLIFGLVVDEQYRGQGIGRTLMSKLGHLAKTVQRF
ncbi:MAG: hypothetical protein C4288_02920 [Leptolyngbya sp. ERB_1_1]